ncbi:MAG: glycolate oxidase subunit GlcE [Halioglobus sp.]
MSDISKQLIERVAAARSAAEQLSIVGQSSKSFMGREPKGVPVSVAQHSGIVSYEPVELVMTARAGTTLTEITAALDEQGQILSFEPPGFGGEASIGGTLACNLSGPARPWSGSVRDMVLGLNLINGKAEQLSFGGQVMKNVAGYDASRMQAGAMGTLGIITEISFKVMPRPAATLTLVREMGAAEAIDTMNQLAGKAKPLMGACWWENKLYLRLSGAQSTVEGTAGQWQGDVLAGSSEFWAANREQQLSFFNGSSPLWRFSIRPSADHFQPEGDWFIDWGGAQRWLRGEYDKNTLEAAAENAGGQVSLFRGGDRSGEVFHRQSPALQGVHQRLKTAFDPDRVFNPGRLYSWL